MENIDNIFKLLIDNVYDLVFLYKIVPCSKFDYVSPSSVKINGYTPQEHYDNPELFYKLIPDDELPLFEFIKENLELIKKPIIIRWIRKDGKIIWTEQRFITIYNKSGELVAFEGFVRDITERKYTEFALRESEKKFRELFHQINDSIFLFKADISKKKLKLIEVNNAACKMLLYSRTEFFNMNTVFKIINKKYFRKVLSYMNKIINKKKVFFECELKDRYSKIIQVDVIGHLSRLNGENVVLVITRDISQRKKLETELIKQQRLESISFLAGGIAHDFNNILSAILGNVSLAKLYINEKCNYNELEELLNDIENASVKAKKLVNRLITFSKGGEPLKEKINLIEFLQDNTSYTLKGTDIKTKIKSINKNFFVEIDKDQMFQVLNNILLNSIESIKNNGIVEINIENVVSEDNEILPVNNQNYVKITIKDNGYGIPKSNINKIFDPFFSTKQGNKGMGLAAVYSIIKRHDGFIDVESKEGKGTSFFIYLPLIDDNINKNSIENNINNVNKKKELLKDNINSNILVMDDDADVRYTIGKLLNKLGYKVTFAREGSEAIELYRDSIAKNEKFGLVIIDLTIIGGMGGKDAMQALLKIDPEINAIVSTGYYNDPLIANYRQYGFKGFLSKPYTVHELEKAIKNII